MAHKKGVGSTDNGRDSISKRLGVKLFGGEIALAGNILVRQRGTKYHPGLNVYMGKDHTLHARVDGEVNFTRKKNNRVFVNIAPIVMDDENGSNGSNGSAAVAAKPEAKVEVTPLSAVVEAAPVVEASNDDAVAEIKGNPAEAQTLAAMNGDAPAPAVEEKPAKATKSAKITLPSGKKIKQDDLKMVEGIGPKIEGLLNEAGITTWKQLAEAPLADVQKVLDDAGPRYSIHQPKTWAKQAELADAANWDVLERYQDWLVGGREPEGETFSFE